MAESRVGRFFVIAATVAVVIGCGESRSRGSTSDGGMDAAARDAAGTDGPVPVPDAALPDRRTTDAPFPDAGPEVCGDGALPLGRGCDFYFADLDNAAIATGRDASASPMLALISNPGMEEALVTITTVTSTGAIDSTMTVTVGARATDTVDLGRREVDGATPAGINDGTGTAVTRNAFRLESSVPVTVHMLNPSTTEGFSVDGTLVLPVHALGTTYTVAAWPQTIAHDATNPDRDFDPTVDDEDLRAFLTVIAAGAPTTVRVTLGPNVVRVVPGTGIPESAPGAVIEQALDAHGVLNLETGGFMADFTGTSITATAPVAVFVGVEAADVPLFSTYLTRQCCADHLEGQLLPDDRLGRTHVVARTPSRAVALNAAFADAADEVIEATPVDWVRVVAVDPGTTSVTTSLPPPDASFSLSRGESRDVRADADFVLSADQRVSVLQLSPSQEAIGIPSEMPGGDPSLVVLPPAESFAARHAFATPTTFPFDFVTIVAPADATVRLDGASIAGVCDRSGIGPEWASYQCQLSFPVVSRVSSTFSVEEGTQNDGYHVVEADRPVGVVVSGFGAFSSYAWAAGWGAAP